MPDQPNDFVKMAEVVGKSYDQDTVVLDGTSYQHCLFNQCKIIYRGGPTNLLSCSISSNCAFELQDSAAFVIQTLAALGWKFVAPSWMGSQNPASR